MIIELILVLAVVLSSSKEQMRHNDDMTSSLRTHPIGHILPCSIQPLLALKIHPHFLESSAHSSLIKFSPFFNSTHSFHSASPSYQAIQPQAGQVWYPDSAYKTAQAIQDFNRGENLPLIIFANWRGFSGTYRTVQYIVECIVYC